MWKYEKKLQYPVDVKNKDLKIAKILYDGLGGPDGELGASLRYLQQRYTMPDNKGKALLTDIGTEEINHIEIISTLIHQLTKDATIDEIKEADFSSNFSKHGLGIYPSDSSGNPFTAATIGITGDYLADLVEDMAAEQKARAGYEHMMSLTKDKDVLGPLAFLREREVVHFERFKELYEYYLNQKQNKQPK
ncbi:MAG: manganese catalase family protein [Bacilli bacterium]